jgi:vacuolar protein sorting-associated protein 35
LKTEKDYDTIDQASFDSEQILVARSIHLVDNSDLKTKWQILKLFIDKFKEGEKKRQKFTYPAAFYAVA